MIDLYNLLSQKSSEFVTKIYSTSFSFGISVLEKKFHKPIYSIYGFVRLADEIVDTFHDYDKTYLLNKFYKDYHEAINNRISLNPILNSFQQVVHKYHIDNELIEKFIKSMQMDVQGKQNYNQQEYNDYVIGSAEVVGLMCLKVFVEGNTSEYEKLKPFAQKLGAAFQKVNFLRDLKNDYEKLGRTYFPNIKITSFGELQKATIEKEIEDDFNTAYLGIKILPTGARGGVLLAYNYYKILLKKIKRTPANTILKKRIRISNTKKFIIMMKCLIQNKFNLL